jgi:hypothetical protein
MANSSEVQGYAKTLYQENKLKDTFFYYTVLLILEYLRKLNPREHSLFVPDLVRNFHSAFNLKLPNFFNNEFWLESSKYILSWLETWETDRKLAKKVFEEFSTAIVSPSGLIQPEGIETLEQAESFLIAMSAYKAVGVVSEKLGLASLSPESLEELLGLRLQNESLRIASLEESSDSFEKIPSFLQNSAPPIPASSVLASSVKTARSRREKRKPPLVKNRLRHIPEEITKFRIKCTKCTHEFSPDWFKLQPEPLIPLKPNNYDGPGRWIMTRSYETCPFCEEIVALDLPIEKMQSRVMLFGDEAYRQHEDKIVYIYSLVGSDSKVLPEIENSVRSFKAKLCSLQLPDTWGLHMTELWSGQQRRKHEVFADWDLSKVQETIDGLFQLVQSHAEYLFIYNIALTTKGSLKGFGAKSTLDKAKSDAYLLLVMYVINELTAQKAQPNLFFDAEKVTKAETVIQGWAREAFSGSQRCLLYPFLSRGIEVPEPFFVQPASRPCLEVADFVSFIIARYYLRKWQNMEIEFDPARLGAVTYLGFDNSGGLLFHRRESYPWELFYGEN